MNQELRIRNKNTGQKGFSVLEVLMAMTILILCLTGVIAIVFGSQTLLTDSQASQLALNKAQGMLEQAQELGRKDFRLVNPIASSADGMFEKKTDVVTQPNLMSKQVTATVSWRGEHNRDLNVSLSALVTNFENAVGGDTCSSVLSGDWLNPQIKNSGNSDISELIGDPGGVYPITDLNAYFGKLYVTVGSTENDDDPTFFIFDITNPNNPALFGKTDNADITAGLKAVAVDGKFAYAASSRSVSALPEFGQLQIFNISDPLAPSLRATFKIPGITTTNTSQAVGSSIFYKDGYVYLGLTKTGTGPEFNIIDVRDPDNPFWVGGFTVGNTVNDLTVKKGYAYLATPNSKELMILNLSDITHPVQAGGFDASGGSGNGKSLDSVGDRLYLGRTAGATEFYILDSSDPGADPLPQLGEKSDIDNSINGLIVRDYLAFLLTNHSLQILKIDDPTSITQLTSPLAIPENDVDAEEPSLECENNTLYVSSNNVFNTGFLYVISTP